MWALISDGIVTNTTGTDPAGRFHESFIWVACGSEVQPGWRYSGREFSAPEAPKAIDRMKVLASVKTELRAMRSLMLDALTGIAGRATRSGNEALAIEADALAEKLLDITDDAALNAATTYDEMQDAGVLAYKRISKTASPALGAVFREITGA